MKAIQSAESMQEGKAILFSSSGRLTCVTRTCRASCSISRVQSCDVRAPSITACPIVCVCLPVTQLHVVSAICVPNRQMTSVLSLSPRVDHPGGVMQGPLLCVFTSTPAVCVQGAYLTTESAHTFFFRNLMFP